MSLLVWLPLLDNLNNQGLSNTIFKAQSGVTQSTAGKIGGCYYLNGKTLSSPGFTHLAGSSDFSACCWVKFTSFPSDSNAYCICLNNTSASVYKFILGVYSNNGTTANFRLNAGNSVGTLELNTWYHLAICVSGEKGSMYINGNLVKSVSGLKSSDCENLVIGGRSTNAAGTSFTGTSAPAYYNDVRIYNHCLSPREVKAIAAGLVLHYKLADNYNAAIDCSGYGRNGSITGTISFDTDTKRYAGSSVFDGSTTGIDVPIKELMQNIMANQCSINFWVKEANTGSRSVYFGGYEGSNFNIEMNGGKFRVYWNGSPDLQISSVENNTWTMFTVTIDVKTGIKIYKNAVLVHETSGALIDIASGFSKDFKIGRDTRTGVTMMEGNMSDFRIYATPLNIDFIQTLYSSAISMMANGQLQAYEYIEDESLANVKFLPSGVVKAGDISEIGYLNGMKITVLEDGSAWARINWINFSLEKTPFQNVNEVAFCDQANRFSKMGLVDHFKNASGVYEFMLTYPSISTTKYNRWTQTCSPNDPYGTETGLVKIKTDYKDHSAALTKVTGTYASSAVYACNSAGNWWAPIGQLALYSSTGIPAADKSTQTETELWVRVENLSTLNKISMLDNKYIQAFNIYEI